MYRSGSTSARVEQEGGGHFRRSCRQGVQVTERTGTFKTAQFRVAHSVFSALTSGTNNLSISKFNYTILLMFGNITNK